MAENVSETQDNAADAQPATLRALLTGPNRRAYWVVALAALLAVAFYGGVQVLDGDAGFPLDDAWIHQTYARNLAQNGRWEFVPGQASAGSTAPLWTILLSPSHLLGLPPLLWALFLGWAALVWCAWAAMVLWSTLWPKLAARSIWAGLAIALSWPLLWAASSGMETMLFSALAFQLIVLYSRQLLAGQWRPGLLGLVGGLLILTRPEGLILLFLICLGMLLVSGDTGQRLGRVGRFLLGATLVLAPYFALNLWSSGHLWPNTFYAKQAEYASLWQEPLAVRFVQLAYFTLGGPSDGWLGMSGARLLLLPGLLAAAWYSLTDDWRARRLLILLPLLWAGGHVLLYAWRLPVLYQHGRYLMPVFPVILLYGLFGWFWLAGFVQSRLRPGQRTSFVGTWVASLVFALLVLMFVVLGRHAYTNDVAFIDGEMVTVARWLNEHTPPDAHIAAHDIGAIGYFSERRLLDLAGLVSPEVVPLLGDEAALADYVWSSDAGFLVTAPGWPYTTITSAADATLLFESEYPWTLQQGSNNMAVYALSP